MHSHFSRSFWLMVVLGLHLYKERKALFAEHVTIRAFILAVHFPCPSIKGGWGVKARC
jgi:hypothetical protein